MIVLNAICRSDHFDILKTRYRSHHRLLQFFWHATRDAIGVYNVYSKVVSVTDRYRSNLPES